MNYCETCGRKLIKKKDGIDGLVPYCSSCRQFKYPTYNSAISSIIFNPDHTKILLIQQYDRCDNILVAGYINKGENAKEALIREIKEETGLTVCDYDYNDNEYYEKTNTLIHNYAVTVDSEHYHLTNEVDKASWFDIKDVLQQMKPNSLAKSFLERYLMKFDNDFNHDFDYNSAR